MKLNHSVGIGLLGAAFFMVLAGCSRPARPGHVAVTGFRPFEKVESAVIQNDGRLVITVIERGQKVVHESKLMGRTLQQGGKLIVVTDDKVQHDVPFTIEP